MSFGFQMPRLLCWASGKLFEQPAVIADDAPVKRHARLPRPDILGSSLRGDPHENPRGNRTRDVGSGCASELFPKLRLCYDATA
jgi:hypothetical protein